jgi:RND family efflux transporter MFP subunit
MTVDVQTTKPNGLGLISAVIALFVGLVILLFAAGISSAKDVSLTQQPTAVTTSRVKIQSSFETPVNIFGLIESPKSTDLAFDVGGQLIEITVDEGDVVTKGQVVAKLDSERLNARLLELNASLARANADLTLAQLSNSRTKTLVDKKLESAQRLDEANASESVSSAQVAEIKAAINSVKVERSKTTLLAPFDGIVNSRTFDEGSVVGAGAPLLGITSAELYQARFAVPADIIDQFAQDEPVLIRVGENDVAGTISQLLPVRNRQTRTVDILVTLNDNSRVRPGDMAVLSGLRTHNKRGSWLPIDALSNGLRGLWRVFVLPEGNERGVEARIVEVIYTDGVNAFVRGALSDNELYITNGTHKLAPGQMVSVKPGEVSGALK